MDHMEKMTFGRWIRAWREARGLSIRGASQRAGWRAQFWSNLEQELRPRKDGLPPKPDEKTVDGIARVLEIPIHMALLAAGHAPPEWQSEIFSRSVPHLEGNAFVYPAVCPHLMFEPATNIDGHKRFIVDNNSEIPVRGGLVTQTEVDHCNIEIESVDYGRRIKRLEELLENLSHQLHPGSNAGEPNRRDTDNAK